MAFYSFLIATPMYEATSKLYVLNQKDSAINLSDLQIGSYLTSDYQEVFDTWEVQQMVIENLQLDCTRKELRDMVEIENPASTRMLYITVTSSNPRMAAAIANEFASVAKKYISDTMETDEPSIMSQALEATKPIRPRRILNTLLGFLTGGMLATIACIIIHMIDDKVKSADDIRQACGLETLAVVPNNSPFKNSAVRDNDGYHAATERKRGKAR